MMRCVSRIEEETVQNLRFFSFVVGILIFASSSFTNLGAYNGIKLRLHNAANNSVQTLVWYPVISEKIEVIKLGSQRSKWIECECAFR